MHNRVRTLPAGRQPRVDPLTPEIVDTVDFSPNMISGVVFADPSLPEDLGTEVVNSQAPATPGTPTVTTGQATDHVYVNASWTAADDQTVPAAQYEVYVNVSGQNPTVIRVAGTITSIRIAPAKPSVTYQVKVRAISRLEVAGTYTSYGSVTSSAFIVPTVTFAPTTPSAPTVTAAVYTLLVSWTALTDVTAGYGHYDVQIATDSGFTANVRLRSIDGTITSFTDLTPGTTYYARVRGVAPDGTAGSWSTGSSTATTKIVNGDITAATITAASIAADTITANEMAADSITASELAAMNIAVNKYIRSTTFTAGSAGWSINAAGDAEFNNITVRGIVTGGGVGSTDYITNGDFEANNTTGWTGTGRTISNVTTAPHGGSRHLKAVYSSGATSSANYAVVLGPIGTYEIVVWARVASGTDSFNLVVTGDASVTSGSYSIGTTYAPIKFLLQTTTENASVSLALTCAGSGHADLYVDDITCHRVQEIFASRLSPNYITGEGNGSAADGGAGVRLTNPGDTITFSGQGDYSGGLWTVNSAGTARELAGSSYNFATTTEYGFLMSEFTTIRVGWTTNGFQQVTVSLGTNGGNKSAKLTTDNGTSYATDPTSFGTTSNWTAVTTNPTGRSWSANHARLGKKVTVWMNPSFPGAMTAGTGAYIFTLPFSVDTSIHPTGSVIGSWGASLGGSSYGGSARVGSSTTVRLTISSSGTVGAASPVAPVSGDSYSIYVEYFTDA